MLDPKISKYNKTLCVCVLALLVFTAFLPALKNNFVNWDDHGYVIDNQAVKSLSWENTKTIFTSFFIGNYQPISILSYSLEYYFYDLYPAGYHLTNLILHLFNSMLVLWLIFILSDDLAVSFIAAILFGIHPLHVESVAWISERKDVLYALFFLGAVISYFYYVKKDRAAKYYYFSLSLFLLALLSKAMAVTLPLTLLLIDYALYRKPDKSVFIEKIPFFALSLIFGMVCVFSQYFNKCTCPFSSILNVMFAGNNIMFYLSKIFWPVHLSPLYPNIEGSAFLFYGLLFLFLVFLKRCSRKIVFGAMLFFINILPVIPLLLVADRYTYVASIGIFYIIGEGFVWLYKRSMPYVRAIRIFLLTALIVIVGVLMLLTWKRCAVWEDSVSLWNDVLLNYPASQTALKNRGAAYTNNGKIAEAIADFTKAIEVGPDNALIYTLRADAYREIGNFEQAINDYNKAIGLDPDNALTYFDRGCAYDGKGDLPKAIHDYTKAIEIDPKNSIEAYNNRGSIYYCRGDFDLAISDYNKIIEIKPDFARAYNDRAAAYLQKKEYDKSLRDIKKVEELGCEPDPELLKKLRRLSPLHRRRFAI